MKSGNYNLYESLIGKIIISAPTISDARFYKSVIVITIHNEQRISGIVINKPSAHQFTHIIKNIQPNIKNKDINIAKQEVFVVLGGPTSTNSLFVLHGNDYSSAETISITPGLSMTNRPGIIFDIAGNKGPKQTMIAIGCVTWTYDQLQQEFANNAWMFAELNDQEILSLKRDEIYENLCSQIGIASHLVHYINEERVF